LNSKSRVGISKAENNIDISVLEDCAREVLNQQAPRVLAVVDPIKVTLLDWPADKVELFSPEPQDASQLTNINNGISFSGIIILL